MLILRLIGTTFDRKMDLIFSIVFQTWPQCFEVRLAVNHHLVEKSSLALFFSRCDRWMSRRLRADVVVEVRGSLYVGSEISIGILSYLYSITKKLLYNRIFISIYSIYYSDWYITVFKAILKHAQLTPECANIPLYVIDADMSII